MAEKSARQIDGNEAYYQRTRPPRPNSSFIQSRRASLRRRTRRADRPFSLFFGKYRRGFLRWPRRFVNVAGNSIRRGVSANTRRLFKQLHPRTSLYYSRSGTTLSYNLPHAAARSTRPNSFLSSSLAVVNVTLHWLTCAFLAS